MALVRRALEIAIDSDLVDDAGTCYFLLSDNRFRTDDYVEALAYLDESLALARRRGNRPSEWSVLAERTYPLCMLGRWDEVRATSDELTPEQLRSGGLMLSLLQSSVEVHIQRGDLDGARRIFSMFSRLEDSTDVQDRSCYLGTRAALRRAEGQLREALADGEAAIETRGVLGVSAQAVKQGFVEAIEAALSLGETATVEELLALVEGVPSRTRPPFLDAQAKRFRARLGGDPSGYEAASERFRERGLPFWLAVTLLEHGELTGDASLLSEAREIFERLGARPWLERLTAVDAEERAHARG